MFPTIINHGGINFPANLEGVSQADYLGAHGVKADDSRFLSLPFVKRGPLCANLLTLVHICVELWRTRFRLKKNK